MTDSGCPPNADGAVAEASRLEVDAEGAGLRIDALLSRRLGRPRNQIRRWIREGGVRLNGHPVKPATAVAEGDRIAIVAPREDLRDPRLDPEPGRLRVLYEDGALVVIDKPADLAVHPGAGQPRGTLANFLLHRYPELAGVGGPGRPGIVHRLDKGTTGLLLVARTPDAYHQLSSDFAERRVHKLYLAVVYGAPEGGRGEIDAPLGRHPRDRKRMAVRQGGRAARTRYRTVATSAGLSILEVELETGRTHQIRVHLKAAGHPLVGDPVYGEARWRGLAARSRSPVARFPRPALHAWRLSLRHPTSGEPLQLESPVPGDLVDLWRGATGEPWPAGTIDPRR